MSVIPLILCFYILSLRLQLFVETKTKAQNQESGQVWADSILAHKNSTCYPFPFQAHTKLHDMQLPRSLPSPRVFADGGKLETWERSDAQLAHLERSRKYGFVPITVPDQHTFDPSE